MKAIEPEGTEHKRLCLHVSVPIQTERVLPGRRKEEKDFTFRYKHEDPQPSSIVEFYLLVVPDCTEIIN